MLSFFNQKFFMASLHPFKGLLFDDTSKGDHCLEHSLEEQDNHYYIYEIEDQEMHSVGLVSKIALADFNEFLRPHEKTNPFHVQDLCESFLVCNIQFKPLILIHDSLSFNKEIHTAKKEAEFLYQKFDEDLACHKLWRVSKLETIDRLTHFSSLLHLLCIADGHHRFEAITRYHQSTNQYNCGKPFILGTVFGTDQIRTRPAGIIINKDIFPDISILFSVHSPFEIQSIHSAQRPTNAYELTFFMDGCWFLLKLKNQFIQQVKKEKLLSREIFNRFILNAFTSQSSRPNRVLYHKKLISSLTEQIDQKKEIGFIISEDQVSQIYEYANNKQFTDPNSTYFEPKLLHGIVGCRLNNSYSISDNLKKAFVN